MKAGCAPRWIITTCPTPTFADQKLRDGNLRAKYDVIIFPHVGGTPQSIINGIAKTGNGPDSVQEDRADAQPRRLDETDDIRGGMGMEGLQELAKFVEEGGTLITEGSTAALMAEYGSRRGVTVEHPPQLCSRAAPFCAASSPI